MASTTVRARARGRNNLAILLGTASLAAIASAAYGADVAPVEEVLVTGSLIRGAAPVGIPVTSVGAEKFDETAAISVSDMLLKLPIVSGNVSVNTVQIAGNNRQRLQGAQIHGIVTNSFTGTLLMVNGRRYPGQGTNLARTDPSLIPSLAIDRIEILAEGASATYGSDAVAGVINIIMKRGYDGAMTQVRVSELTDLGWDTSQVTVDQLYGRKWDSGDITVSYEWWDKSDLMGNKNDAGRPYFTTDFRAYGFDDQTPLGSSYPGVISVGAPSAVGIGYPVPTGGTVLTAQRGDRYCNNCFLLTPGVGWDFGTQAPGPTTTWATVLANKQVPGHNNLRSPYEFTNLSPSGQANYATVTFDQNLANDVFGLFDASMFVDAFYMNRRYRTLYPVGYAPSTSAITPISGEVVPTNNPYIPLGAPANIRVHFSLGKDLPNYSTEGSISKSYAFGLNFDDLPGGWHGSVFHQASEEFSFAYLRNIVNQNLFDAAMGLTVASVAAAGTNPARLAYTKPADVPYLNPFCDAIVHQCNSPVTLDYISGTSDMTSNYEVRQFGGNFSGPLFDLPGGTVQAAIGVEKVSQHFGVASVGIGELTNATRTYTKQLNWAVFGQADIPLVGGDFTFPGIEKLTISLGYRYDEYYELGGVTTPKLGINWEIFPGFTAHGTKGTSFNAPAFGTIRNFEGGAGNQMINANFMAGNLVLNCPTSAAPNNPVGSVVPGSLQAYLNPGRVGCPANAAAGLPAGPADPAPGAFDSKLTPIGIQFGHSVLDEQGKTLSPETSNQWSAGFTYAPTKPIFGVNLTGLRIDASWWNIQRENLIISIQAGTGVNDPGSLDLTATTISNANPFKTRWIVAPRPDLLLTAPENASFKALVDHVLSGELDSGGRAGVQVVNDAINYIKFVQIFAVGFVTGNAPGWEQYSGIDFNTRYDWDMGDWGTWGASIDADYRIRHRVKTSSTALTTSDYTGITPETGLLVGTNSGNHLNSARFGLRWSDMANAFSVNLGSTWLAHSFSFASGGMPRGTPPACYFQDIFGPGSDWAKTNGYVGCYPGSPFYPQPTFIAPPGTTQPAQRFGGVLQPSQMFFDLGFGYNTGRAPANPYLQNIRLNVNINNVLNRLPSAINYDPRVSTGSQSIRQGDPLQRTVTVTVSKSW